MRYSTVVVGSDGSPTALRAVDAAAEAARANGVRLIVVCAYHPVSPSEQALVSTDTGGEDGKHRVTAKKTAKDALDRSIERARAIAPDTTGELVKDDACARRTPPGCDAPISAGPRTFPSPRSLRRSP